MPKALALIEAPDHVCGRYRVSAFRSKLEAAGWFLSVEPIPRRLDRRLALLHSAARHDAVLLQRKLLPAWQFAILRGRARRLIFDFDDAVLFRDSNDPRGPNCPRRAAGFRRVANRCDLVIAGNEFLANYAREAGASDDRIRVIPTCVNPSEYPEGTSARDDDRGLELVWIGSSSTLQGIERTRALWERIGREVPGTRLKVICDRFPTFDSLSVIPVDWTREGEAAELSRSDVGVGWVPDDLWSRGKCGLKILQYQAARLPVVANPVGVQSKMIEHGRSGFLASSADDWVRAIRSLSESPRARREMGAAARASVERNYAVDVWSNAFIEALSGRSEIGRGPRASFRLTGSAAG